MLLDPGRAKRSLGLFCCSGQSGWEKLATGVVVAAGAREASMNSQSLN